MAQAPNLAQTLSDKIADTIGERILSGEYAPGERLIEAMLARELRVSHSPVRDALRLLHNAGLVTIAPYRGAVVAEFSEREILELYQIRAALVGLRARWLAEDPEREKVLSQVAGTIGRLPALARSTATKNEYIAAALEVSKVLTDHVVNRWLRSALQALALQTRRYTRISLESPERRQQSARSWTALLRAMRAGDGARAQALATSQSLSTRDAALQSFRAKSDAGAGKKKPSA